MHSSSCRLMVIAVAATVALSCSMPTPSTESANGGETILRPSEVIDLGALVTEDLPQRVWGKAFLNQMGFTRPNAFDVIQWNFPFEGGTVSGSNAYYTLFNHGGPHVDAPNHYGLAGGLDSYPIEAFSGPLKVFDVSNYPLGRSVPTDVFRGEVEAGDIVLIFTRYMPPQSDDATPDFRTLTHEAAEFLATLPVRSYGTDAFSVETSRERRLPSIHHSFLSRSVPIYEQLFNVDRLLAKENMFFVGVPLNVRGGDGMIVRPVVFIY